jgi:hypothetical protein
MVPPHGLSVAFAPLLVAHALSGWVSRAPSRSPPGSVRVGRATGSFGGAEVLHVALAPGALRGTDPLVTLGSRQARAAAAAERRSIDWHLVERRGLSWRSALRQGTFIGRYIIFYAL